MRIRLNEGVLTSYNPETMMGVAVVKVIDEENMLVEIDAKADYVGAGKLTEVNAGEHWKLTGSLTPKYIAGATVEILGPDPRRGSSYQVKLIKALRPLPRNALFSRTFYVRRSHLASRA